MSEIATSENSILLSNGEINPRAYITDPLKKLEALREKFPKEKYNIVMFSQFLMNQLPEGITLHPQFIEITDEDLWDEKNAAEVKLKPGQVMIKSEKIINIGQAVGIRLEKVVEEEISLNKVPHLRILYVASLTLPDGTKIESPPVGKCLPIINQNGKVQAHIHESVDGKAKRNAIKHLLSIPTAMEKAEAKKMWMCVRAVAKEGSVQSENKVKTVEGAATVATSNLYGDEPSAPKVKPYTAEEFKAWIKECNTQQRWDDLRDELSLDIIGDELVFLGLKTLLANKYRELNPKEPKL